MAAPVWPLSTVSFGVDEQDYVDTVWAQHVNELRAEVLSIETVLGLDLQGTSGWNGASFTTGTSSWATLTARLANIENGVVGDAHSQYIHKSGGDTIQSDAAVGLTIRANSGAGSPDSVSITDGTGVTQYVGVAKTGVLTSNIGLVGNTYVKAQSAAASDKPLQVVMHASQSANAVEVTKSGSTKFAITPAGSLLLTSDVPGSPATGEVWMTSSGLYTRTGSATVGPIIPATSVTQLSGLQSAVVGTSQSYARQDHKHDIVGLVDFVSVQNSIGGAKTFTSLLTGSAGLTITGAKTTLAASVSGYASLNIPHGATPTSPTPSDGDVWTTTAGMYVRVNGATIGPLNTNGPATTVTTLTGLQSAVVGTSTLYARQDHQHAVAGVVDFVSAQNSIGGAKTFTALLSASAGLTVTGGAITAAVGTASYPSLKLGANGVAPSSPAEGDVWKTSSALLYRDSSATRTVVNTDQTQALYNKTLDSTNTITSPTLTLSTTTSTAEGRIAWDSANDQLRVGDGTGTRTISPDDKDATLSNKTLTNPLIRPTVYAPTVSGNNYTLVTADEGKVLLLNNGSTAMNLTVPAALFGSNGAQVTLVQTGTGQVTILVSGTTVSATPGLKLRAQYSAATLIRTGTNTYIAVGDLSA